MSLDFYSGQRVVCVDLPPVIVVVSALRGLPLPILGRIYTIGAAQPCDACGCHVSLREMGPILFFSHCLFRPVEPKEMDVLRGLLAPDAPRIPSESELEPLWYS